MVGIDYEREYVTKAARVIAGAGLSEAVKVHCPSSSVGSRAERPRGTALTRLPLLPSARLRCITLDPSPRPRQVHCLSIYQPGLRAAFAGKAKCATARQLQSPELATICMGGCSPVHAGLSSVPTPAPHPATYAQEAAALCTRGSNCMHQVRRCLL